LSREERPSPRVFDYLPVTGGGKPVVPLRLSTELRSTAVVATIAPSLPRTILSPIWAAAIDLSPGASAVAQILRAFSSDAEPWGPEEIIVPVVAEELDEPAWRAAGGELDEDDAGAEDSWRLRDACLLGHDFLRNVAVLLIGQQGRLALLDVDV
jgi:hypothetical protein